MLTLTKTNTHVKPNYLKRIYFNREFHREVNRPDIFCF